MPIDTSIYGQLRPFRMDDPMEQAAKAYSIRAHQLGIQDAERKFQLEDDLSGALSATGGDLTKASQLLAQRGRGQAALQLQDKAATQRKAQVDEKLKLFEATGSDAIALDQLFRQAKAAGADDVAATAKVQPIWSQVRAKYQGMGFDLPEQFDPQRNFAFIGTAKENIQYLKTLQPSVHMTDTGGTVTPTNTNPMAGPVGPVAGAQPIPKTPAPAAPTELSRLQAERNSIAQANPNDPRLKNYDRVIAGYKAGRGDTSLTVNTGPMTPGKTAGNKVDETMLETTQNLMQLDQIAGQFKPEYQTLMTRGANWWSAVKEKAGADLKNKEKADLEEFSKYKRNAIDSLNKYIKSITGAAMTNAEADRILKGLPNPGSGLFDGDSPTEFKAKLDDAMKSTKMSVARLAYIKRNGMSLEDGQGNAVVPLDRMPAIINERGKAIEDELKKAQPKADPKALGRAVRRQLSLEFGLSSD